MAALYRGGKFKGLKKPGKLIFTFFLYDKLKVVSFETKEVNIPQKMVMASDKDRIYFSGSVTIKMREPEKAFTVVENYEKSLVEETNQIMEEEIGKTTLSDIKGIRRDFDNNILEMIKTKAEPWGIEIKKVKLTIDR